MPFLEATEQMPTYAKFLKEIISKRRKVERYETVVTANEYYYSDMTSTKEKRSEQLYNTLFNW